LQRRLYKFKKKHVRKDGTVTIGPNRQWKWVKGETKQRKYRPRGQSTMWSKRFGYLDTYTYNERKLLKCPSGYTFGQGMHALHRLWFAYKSSKSEENIAKTKHYARAIQEVQEDMGLKTTSFPHLGIFGDVLVFRDHKTGQYGEEIDHSELKERQEFEEERKKFEEIAPLIQADIEKGEELLIITDDIPQLEEQKEEIDKNLEIAPLIEPDIEKGEELLIITDDIPQLEEQKEELLIITDEIPRPPKYRIKHENRMHFSKKRDQEWICEECGETVLANKNHICKHKEQGNVLTMSDEIPFRESS
jgi:hypothetical protein